MFVKEGNQVRRFRWFDLDDLVGALMRKVKKKIKRRAVLPVNKPRIHAVKTKYTRKRKHKDV